MRSPARDKRTANLDIVSPAPFFCGDTRNEFEEEVTAGGFGLSFRDEDEEEVDDDEVVDDEGAWEFDSDDPPSELAIAAGAGEPDLAVIWR